MEEAKERERRLQEGRTDTEAESARYSYKETFEKYAQMVDTSYRSLSQQLEQALQSLEQYRWMTANLMPDDFVVLERD